MAGKNSVFTILIDRIRIEKKRHGGLTLAKLGGLIFSRKGRRQLSAYWVKASDYLMRFILRIPPKSDRDYSAWIKKHALSIQQLEEMRTRSQLFEYKPVFSILLPVYDPPEEFLRACVRSVIDQAYPYWELCVSDDCSKNPQIRKALLAFAETDSRIKLHFREVNGHISENSNSAMMIATGEFAALLDHDDLLAPEALFRCAELLQKEKEADIIYSDEDKVNERGKRMMPFFKPDWSPDSFLCRNYVCHFTVIRMNLMRAIGGFRKGFEGSQDHDLLIRAVERTNSIFHVPEILYHWRLHSSSTAMNHEVKPYATIAGIKAVEESLMRTSKAGAVQPIKNLPGCYRVSYALDSSKAVTVVIPLKKGARLDLHALEKTVQKCKTSIKEIIIASQYQLETVMLNSMDTFSKSNQVMLNCIAKDSILSNVINEAVKTASGDFLLILSNGCIPEDDLAIHHLAASAQYAGVVGSRIISDDDYLVSAGIRINPAGRIIRIFSGAVSEHPGYFNSLKCVNNQSLFSSDFFLVRKSVWEVVNGLDENFTGDLAAADFCMKVLEAGYRNVYIPDAAMRILCQYSKLNLLPPSETETQRFIVKWKHVTQNDPSFNPHLDSDKPEYVLTVC